ncbi:RNA polymerase I-specific transcription initiation factor rrn3 [Psilocybe cubensis]|uniref:RNA polymerase I-specific transcription initiation factor rrn3 n=2 Tax=Psilocybe cubensis TaxID=181762 RepID=A0ACB8H4D8_PSICU|nr:RNA polymerase I-specific transcription initiation factor rrn3 [Psilocybe cubensis]KAH9482507.1 RNA polymerase I-specific transcription initiation factor rrn3 [Psilocybe cubensis]
MIPTFLVAVPTCSLPPKKYKDMDPHSRRSQFNHRTPKAGPLSRNIDSMPPQPSQKPESSKVPPPRKTASHSSATTNLLIRRPIATNSRVKQDEMFKRDMYLSVVTNALQQKANGVSDTFDELVSQFNISPSSSSQHSSQFDPAQIRLWLLALSHVVSRLEKTHSALVDAIVNMPWTTFDSATVKSFTVFIGMLLSARPEYLSLVLAKIAHGFTYQSGLQALDAGIPSTSSAPLTRRVIYDRVHFLLRHILSLVPTLPSTLQPLLVRHFPHKRQNQVAQTTYIRNLLRVSGYCPELADKILATIVDRAIQIDVEIQIELEELEEEENEGDEDVFELDPFDIVLGQEVSSSASDTDDSDDESDDNFSDLSSEAGDMDDFDLSRRIEVPMNVKHIQEMVKKLDAILTLLFEHFERSKGASSISTDSRPMSPLELPPLPPLESNPLTPTDFLSSRQSLDLTASTEISAPTTETSSSKVKLSKLSGTKTSLHSQFQSLLSIFDRTILRTFKSRYTQFLVFWFASLDPEFADIFQGMLVERALMPSSGGFSPHTHNDSFGDGEESTSNSQPHTMTPELTRAAAASYIGSFVSRATFVDRDGTRRVVSVLCEYLRSHLDGVEADVRLGLGFGSESAPSSVNAAAALSAILASGQHTVFYAVTQAVFLIFCFRWRDLLGGDDDLDDSYVDLDLDLDGRTRKTPAKDKWMPELSVLKRVVTSILNPLKVCSSNVVMQFARVAQATDFIYCYTMLEMNKRNDMSFASISGTSASGPRPRLSNGSSESLLSSLTLLQAKLLYQPANAELNTFFPFDPYRLPKSNAFIQGVYREWSSVAIESDDDDDDESDVDEEEDQLSSDQYDDFRSGGLDVPREKNAQKSDDDGGLGESLGAMSISPARMSISVSMRG